jgi:TonB family protein
MVGHAARFPAGVRELRGAGRCLLTVRRLSLLFAMISTLAAAVCPTKGPVLHRVLETEELLKQSSHCVSPQLPLLGKQVRIHGVVSVRILVDPHGNVICVKLIKGHPLMIGAAIEAASKWSFRPMTERGRPVSFFGRLVFQYSTIAPTGPPWCTSAHWCRRRIGGADPQVRAGPPGPALRARNCVHRDRPTRASAADQGVRPTVSPGAPPSRVKQIRRHLRILIVRR